MHGTPEYQPAQKLKDTLSNPYFTLVIAGDDLKEKQKYAEAKAKYDEAQKMYNKNLATQKDFEKVKTKWTSADNLLKEANKHSAPTTKPKPANPKPATQNAAPADTPKKGKDK